MAKSNSTVIAGIPFGACEKFGPRTLAAMFGPTLPTSLRPDSTGAVCVARAARLLNQKHAEAMAVFADDVIVVPGTPEALAEFK